MSKQTLTKLEVASHQLETAIGLFISGRDRLSAITLAGAADGILHGLVLKAGMAPFADYAMAVREAMSGETPAKAKFGRHINDTLNINDLKHMDPGGADQIELEIDISALGAILKAIANHKKLVPQHPDFIRAMLVWAWYYWDGERIREEGPHERAAGHSLVQDYANRPQSIQAMEARRAKLVDKKVNAPAGSPGRPTSDTSGP